MKKRDPHAGLPDVPAFELTSEDVADGRQLGNAQVSGILGAGGEDVSPQLSWRGFPEGTRSFAVTCFDPDAPMAGGYWHWAVADIPASVTELPRGAGDDGGTGLPQGAHQLENDAHKKRFVGAAPPPGHGPHRYVFSVHALDVESLSLAPSARPKDLEDGLRKHTVGRAEVTGTYERRR